MHEDFPPPEHSREGGKYFSFKTSPMVYGLLNRAPSPVIAPEETHSGPHTLFRADMTSMGDKRNPATASTLPHHP